jgi:hypothetical protein
MRRVVIHSTVARGETRSDWITSLFMRPGTTPSQPPRDFEADAGGGAGDERGHGPSPFK